MIRIIARFWAKRRYIFRQEMEAALNDLNAAVSFDRAKDKRDLVAQLNKEAEDIEKNIEKVAAEDAAKQLAPKEQYEADQERKDAEKIAQSKRDYAAQLPEEIKGQEDTAKHFRRQAASSRELADRLKQL
jgi:hypothetical protein